MNEISIKEIIGDEKAYRERLKNFIAVANNYAKNTPEFAFEYSLSNSYANFTMIAKNKKEPEERSYLYCGFEDNEFSVDFFFLTLRPHDESICDNISKENKQFQLIWDDLEHSKNVLWMGSIYIQGCKEIDVVTLEMVNEQISESISEIRRIISGI